VRNFSYISRFMERICEFYFAGDKIRCLLCPHKCLIEDGKSGICGTRLNNKGVLYSLSYGRLCSMCIDPIEKKPLYHFLPGSKVFSVATPGCNFRCLNCQNWSISQTSSYSSGDYRMTPKDIVDEALRHEAPTIAFTYTEPVISFEYLIDTFKLAKEKGIRTSIISNGYINREPLEELCRYLDAANIDLKAFDNSVYRSLTGASLKPVLDTLITLKKRGVWLEITNLVIPGYNDSPAKMREMFKWLIDHGFNNTPVHISRFFPAYQLSKIPPTDIFVMKEAVEIAKEEGMRFIYLGNFPFAEYCNTHCTCCGSTLVKRGGYNAEVINIVPSAESFSKEGVCGNCKEIIPGIWH